MFEAASSLRTGLAVALVATGVGLGGAPTQDPLDTLRTLLLEARYAEVETRARALLVEAETASGPDSIRVAQVMDALVEALWRGGKVRAPETRALAERTSRSGNQLGPEHPDVGYSLTTLGIVSRLRGDYQGAKSHFDTRARDSGSSARTRSSGCRANAHGAATLCHRHGRSRGGSGARTSAR